MDQCQITGSCSSYARKYALNALLAINDVKDSDDNALSPKNPKNEDKEPNPPMTDGRVTKGATVPPTNENPVQQYMKGALEVMQEMFGLPNADEALKKFTAMRKALIEGGVVPNTKKITTIEEAKACFDAIYRNFKPSDGESA